MEAETIFILTTKAIAGSTLIVACVGFFRGVVKYIKLRKHIIFTYSGEEKLN